MAKAHRSAFAHSVFADGMPSQIHSCETQWIFDVVEAPLSELKRGDLVLVEVDGKQQIKRLIGLPGEEISIHDGKVFINGVPLIEQYEVIPPPYTVDKIVLDDDSYFVLGDNRPDSYDSHAYGPVKGSNIKGRATPW
jgi:signal peptidase I